MNAPRTPPLDAGGAGGARQAALAPPASVPAGTAAGGGGAAGAPRLASIRGRLANALLFWALAWGVVVTPAVWLAARHEVDELLDDTLEGSAELLGSLLANGSHVRGGGGAASPVAASERFAWQLVDAQGEVLLRSSRAPPLPLAPRPAAGFSDLPEWRLFGFPLVDGQRMLYVAQSRDERLEANSEVALAAALTTLAIGLAGQLWLRGRVRRELAPLAALSERLRAHDPVDVGATLGPAERAELQPVHAAVDGLGRRLARRIANERAFAVHAAHALRTPLAGIDAQLAVALREGPPESAPRLLRAREAAARLQRVVTALLGLFRTGAEPARRPVDLAALLPRLPIDGLTLRIDAPAWVDADPDLLAAALLNLLDNALRHGAVSVAVTVAAPATVRLHDDGEGVAAARRHDLQAALDAQTYEGRMGLGLMLADQVARSHGGALSLPDVARGFAVEMRLGAGG